VASPRQQSLDSRITSLPHFRAFDGRKDEPSSAAAAASVTALSVEFVAKPQEAHRVQSAIPTAIAHALEGVTGFAGCLVMISEQEARLVTVITLWVGSDRQKQCRDNARWVQKLLTPYLDRWLRVQTLATHSPALTQNGFGVNFEDECSTGHSLNAEDETACVV
jgi:hypothetical protein